MNNGFLHNMSYYAYSFSFLAFQKHFDRIPHQFLIYLEPKILKIYGELVKLWARESFRSRAVMQSPYMLIISSIWDRVFWWKVYIYWFKLQWKPCIILFYHRGTKWDIEVLSRLARTQFVTKNLIFLSVSTPANEVLPAAPSFNAWIWEFFVSKYIRKKWGIYTQ